MSTLLAHGHLLVTPEQVYLGVGEAFVDGLVTEHLEIISVIVVQLVEMEEAVVPDVFDKFLVSLAHLPSTFFHCFLDAGEGIDGIIDAWFAHVIEKLDCDAFNV